MTNVIFCRYLQIRPRVTLCQKRIPDTNKIQFMHFFVFTKKKLSNFFQVLAQMSVVARWHPMFLMMPATFACSYAYCLPIATPPNALVAAPCNLPTKHMIVAGLGLAIISVAVTMAIFPLMARAIFSLDEFPDWLEES